MKIDEWVMGYWIGIWLVSLFAVIGFSKLSFLILMLIAEIFVLLELLK